MKLALPGLLWLFAASAVWATPIPLTAKSDDARWTLLNNVGNSMDFFDDHQTGGNADGEIIGDGANPGFLYSFDHGGTVSPDDGAGFQKDGTMTFRVRMSGDDGAAGFAKVLFVGMDLDLNGSLDMFLGVDHQSANRVGVFNGDSGEANLGPSTAGVVNTPVTAWNESTLGSAAYGQIVNWSPVYTIEAIPSGSAGANIDADNGADYFLTFRVDFAAVVALAVTKSPGFNDATPVRFVLASSNSNATLNLDLGGIDDRTITNNDPRSWTDFGAFTPILSANPSPYAPPITVPEPSTGLLCGLGLCSLCWVCGAKRLPAVRRTVSQLFSSTDHLG